MSMMTGKEKLYFLLNRIEDARDIAPSGQPLLIDPTNDLNNNYRGVELDQLFTKLEKDEQVLKILQVPNRVRSAILREYGEYEQADDGCYHIKLLPSFATYYTKVQQEQEYQEYSSRRPTSKPDKVANVDSWSGGKVAPPNYGKREVSAEVLISDLQAKYLEIQNEKSDSNFYLKMAGYGKYLNESEIVHPILNQLRDELQNQIADLKQSWVEFFETWKEYARDLIYTSDKNGVKDRGPLQNEIEEVRAFLDKPDLQFNSDELPHYFYSYREIILRFDKLGKKNLIAKKHLDEDGNIKLYPEFNKVEVEWVKFKKTRELSIWWAHYQISRLASGVFGDKEEKSRYFSNDNIVDQLYKNEFERVSRGTAAALVVVKRYRFEEWITRLHSYLIPRLRELPKSHETDSGRKYNQLLEKIKASSENQITELKKRYEKTLAELKTRNGNTSGINDGTVSLSERGLEKKWDALQSIWSSYEASSRADSILVPIAALIIKDRSPEEIDQIIEGLRRTGCFAKWERGDRWYSLDEINHPQLSETYGLTKTTYTKPASENQKLLKTGSKTTPPALPIGVNYNAIAHTIQFAGKEVPIPPNTDQDSLCKTVFKNDQSKRKEWSWDQVLEEWGGEYEDKNNWRKVYNAGREVNTKVAIETAIKDLLLVKKLTIAVNPKYFG